MVTAVTVTVFLPKLAVASDVLAVSEVRISCIQRRISCIQTCISCIQWRIFWGITIFFSWYKGNHSFWKSQIYSSLLFWACSTLLNWLRHLLWHLPERCVLGYVLLLNICDVSYTLATLTWVFSTPLVQEVYLGIPWVALRMCGWLLHPVACWCLGMWSRPFWNLCPCRE